MKTWQFSICIGVDRFQVLLNLIWCHKLKCCWFWSGLYSWNTTFRLQLQASKISAPSFRRFGPLKTENHRHICAIRLPNKLFLWNLNPNFRLRLHYTNFFPASHPEMLGLRIHNLESNTQNFAFANSKIWLDLFNKSSQLFSWTHSRKKWVDMWLVKKWKLILALHSIQILSSQCNIHDQSHYNTALPSTRSSGVLEGINAFCAIASQFLILWKIMLLTFKLTCFNAASGFGTWPHQLLFRPVECCPFDINAPLFGAYQCRSRYLKVLLVAVANLRCEPCRS